MNRNRIILAGLAAGILWIVIDFVGHGTMLMNTYAKLGAEGIIHAEPQIPFLPLLLIANLAIGLALACLYAAVRPRLGPGPKTALLIGLAVFLVLIPPNLSQAAWSKMTIDVKSWSFVIAAVQAFGASLLAGWLYKE
ncbi:MAG: hypothetical protein HY342_07880 [Candidatus Lambdaproteobacteria bacterium]|nr:hypothetical protein [Candidatus Lambdaproteobacteria bacterium]